MMALIDGKWDWLMYLREDGDAGSSSRNPYYTGTANGGNAMDFLLSNGQPDYDPLSYTLSGEQIINTLDYFKKHHNPHDFIARHNDGFY